MNQAAVDLFQVYDADETTLLVQRQLKEPEMDGQDIAPYRDDRTALAVQNAELQATVRNLTEQLDARRLEDGQVAQARVVLHTTSSAFLYVAGATLAGGPVLDHPHLALVLLTLNVAIWAWCNMLFDGP